MSLARNAEALARHRLADRHTAQPARFERGDDVVPIGSADLNHRTELLVEQRRDRRSRQLVERDVEAAAAGERHLGQRGEEAAIRAVVVGQQPVLRVQRLHGREERLERFHIVQIRRGRAQAIVDLREG